MKMKSIGILLFSFLVIQIHAIAQENSEIKTIRLGTNIWMAENLNINIDGSFEVPKTPEDTMKYGRLYTWESATKACPTGWRLPNENDWNELVNINGGEDIAGYSLKIGGNSGFNASASGMSSFAGYMFKGYMGGYWTANKYDDEHAWYRYFLASGDFFVSTFYSISYGFSVRCVKDKPNVN